MSGKPKGHYDEECEKLLNETEAAGVIVIVLAGNKGTGFSLSAIDPQVVLDLPSILRTVADKIEKKG